MRYPSACFRPAILVLLVLVLAVTQPSSIGCRSVTAFSTTTATAAGQRRPTKWISTTSLRQAANKDDDDDRSQGLRQALSGLGQIFSKDNAVRVGSTVVANSNVPELQIWQFQSYTVEAIWDQGVPRRSNAGDDDNNNDIIEKIPCETLDAAPTKATYTRYVSLYAAKHHDARGGAVTVQYPDEVVLVPLRDEVLDSVVMALPLFGFWTALAASFAAKYNARYGGDFMDALFRSKGL